MKHAPVYFRHQRLRVNTYELEAVIASMAAAAAASRFESEPTVSEWLSRWTVDVCLYGVAHFDLGLDDLLEQPANAAAFRVLLDRSESWLRAQGKRIDSSLTFSMVGGEHWSRSNGWSTVSAIRFLASLRAFVAP